MSEIALLANSDDMYSSALEAVAHSREDIDVFLTHTYEESLHLAKDFEEKGGRLIIARGGHARILKASNIHIPVTSIPFTGNNIVSLLTQAARDWDEFAVIGNPIMIQMTRELERPIGAKVHYYEIKQWTDFDAIIPLIRSAGIKAVIGGYDVSRAARAYGIHDYCITTNEYEIVAAIVEGTSILAAMDRDRYWSNLFRATLDTIGEGVVVADSDGQVSHSNRRANKLLSAGKPLLEINDIGMLHMLSGALSSGTPIYDELLENKDYKFTASFLPIRDNVSKAVIVMQEVEYVHKIEQKIRQKLANKGLVAKNSFENIHAESPALQEAVRKAKQYAIVNSSVLIFGETGTGKEMFAQSIHNYSKRSSEAFVAVNCATIPSNLLESELFGYVEGAFTGAKRGGKVGLFELAHKGTIFLDEIGETSLDMQARLLRVLEEHEIMRVGDDKVIPVDIRVIAASNRDLKKMVDEGKFRSDFYYRLDVLSLNLPPLRDCKENIHSLIDHFTERYTQDQGKAAIEYDEESMRILTGYNWPGNVRELKNVVERLVVTNYSGIITAQAAVEALHLKNAVIPPPPAAEGSSLVTDMEAQLIRRVLEECGGNKSEAAKRLGISRPTLHRKLRLMEGEQAL